VIARDSSSFLAAKCKVYQGISDPLCIEAIALTYAVALAVVRGYERVICETDCEVLLKHWVDRVIDRSVIKPILDEIG
jgi:hypothetical protein